MNTKKSSIKWRFSKGLLWPLVIVFSIVPFLGAFWVVAQFDLPFLHGGDKSIMYLILFIWWTASTIFIFGWKVNENQE